MKQAILVGFIIAAAIIWAVWMYCDEKALRGTNNVEHEPQLLDADNTGLLDRSEQALQ